MLAVNESGCQITAYQESIKVKTLLKSYLDLGLFNR